MVDENPAFPDLGGNRLQAAFFLVHVEEIAGVGYAQQSAVVAVGPTMVAAAEA